MKCPLLGTWMGWRAKHRSVFTMNLTFMWLQEKGKLPFFTWLVQPLLQFLFQLPTHDTPAQPKKKCKKNKENNFWSWCGDIKRACFSLLLLLTCIHYSLPYTWSAQYLQNSTPSILLYYEYYTLVNKMVWLECSIIIIYTGRRKIISNLMVKSYKNYAWTLFHLSLMSLVMLKAQCTWLTDCYHGHDIK